MNDRAVILTDLPGDTASGLPGLKTVFSPLSSVQHVLSTHRCWPFIGRSGGISLIDKPNRGGGAKVIDRLSHDLRKTFPDLGGFSRANLYMRAFANAWSEEVIVQRAVGELPWGHNIVLLTKLKDTELRLAYAEAVIEFGWSLNVLTMHIKRKRIERQGKAITYFDRLLPKPESDLARESLKDPYQLDFLGLGDEAQESEIEASLIGHITAFLTELGVGVAYVGRRVHFEVGGDDFYLDLLFYHLQLRCYVVIAIKSTKFNPKHVSQLGFYMPAVDWQIKRSDDGKAIGLLLC